MHADMSLGFDTMCFGLDWSVGSLEWHAEVWSSSDWGGFDRLFKSGNSNEYSNLVYGGEWTMKCCEGIVWSDVVCFRG